MKHVALVILLFLVVYKPLQASDDKPLGTNALNFARAKNYLVKQDDEKRRKLVLKMNLSPLVVKSLAFMGEYAINKKFSVGLGYTSVLERNLPQIFFSANVQFSSPTFKGSTITPEFRWYPFHKKKKVAPAGFYLAAYSRYASYSFAQTMTYHEKNTGIDISANATHTYKGITFGGMIGLQAIAKGGFTFDWWIMGAGAGTGSYTYAWSNPTANFNQTQQSEALQQYLDYFKNVGFIGSKILDVTTSANGISAKAKGLPMYSTRIMGFCLGYSF